MDVTPDHPTLSRDEGTCWHQRNPGQSQAPSYQPSSSTKKQRASVDRTDSQRGKYVVMKTKENFQGSREVSNTNAKVRIAVHTHLHAEFDAGSQRLPPPGPHSPGFPFAWIWPPCPSHSLQEPLLRTRHPKLTAGPLLKADTLIHSFPSIFCTHLPPQIQTSTYWSSLLR